MKIDRRYYTVEQLAEHWLISIDDILQLGLTNQLAFLTQADWEYPRTKLMLRGEHTGITDQELANIYFAKEPFLATGNAGETANGILKGEECVITYHPGLDRLIIDASEVKRFEREHPELAATDNTPKPNEEYTPNNHNKSDQLARLNQASMKFWGNASPLDKTSSQST
ncbi:MAG: hypothetical protein Q8Q50_08490 [Methylobacter sp.]|nr:hypothetical protein [Methylobacter sp.]